MQKIVSNEFIGINLITFLLSLTVQLFEDIMKDLYHEIKISTDSGGKLQGKFYR